MHCGPPDMVCETKIVAAEDHEALPGAKKDALLAAAGAMWPPLPAAPGTQRLAQGGLLAGAGPPLPKGSAPLTTHWAPPLPAALCFALTRSLLLTCLVPAGLLGLRYYYSRKVVLAYLDCALHTDMADIEQYYMKPPGSCFWVAVLDGNVVGIVAARAHAADNTVELLRMSVDSRFRGKGIAKALGRKVLEFALVHNYSAVVLGTTAVKVAAHKLYESLGFRHMGSSDRYVMPGMTLSLAERLFFQVRYHRYRLQLREE
ncbi:PREDICTED: N-acetylaspartate synthetase [Lipotes vexillifer]|uniref:N-acetylaspartate synthetase n=1 Tax=Lipotes vexillifer TaxID=118797 RepID=A0A340Y919_LIPVE|nr:PREDICTED: N-acetylaspartate synthetase [Lipotes vexillifer]